VSQCVAACRSSLQSTLHPSSSVSSLSHSSWVMLPGVAVCRSVLQCAAVCCYVLKLIYIDIRDDVKLALLVKASIPRSSVRFRQTPKQNENSNLHGFELYRPSSKGTKLLFEVIKAKIITYFFRL